MKTKLSYDVQKIQVDSAKSLGNETNLQTPAEAINKSKEFSSSKSTGFVDTKYEKPFPDNDDSEDREEDTVNFLGWSYGY